MIIGPRAICQDNGIRIMFSMPSWLIPCLLKPPKHETHVHSGHVCVQLPDEGIFRSRRAFFAGHIKLVGLNLWVPAATVACRQKTSPAALSARPAIARLDVRLPCGHPGSHSFGCYLIPPLGLRASAAFIRCRSISASSRSLPVTAAVSFGSTPSKAEPMPRKYLLSS